MDAVSEPERILSCDGVLRMGRTVLQSRKGESTANTDVNWDAH